VFQRKTSGSVVCPSCGSLVGVRDDKCYNCGRANPGLWGFAPLLRQLGADFGFAPLVIGASSLLYVLMLLASGGNILGGGLFSILSPSSSVLRLFGASGAYPVFYEGAWWTVLSATWLHAGLLHIVFNMMWVRDIGPATAEVIGPARTVIIYTVAGVCGFLLSSVAGAYFPLPIPFLRGATLTVGASASVFGLLFPGIDNYAHGGGFLGGYAASAFFNPLTRERGDHVLMAVICLAATFLAIVFSVWRGLAAYS
jgi:rhomboid protease GluP